MYTTTTYVVTGFQWLPFEGPAARIQIMLQKVPHESKHVEIIAFAR